MSEEGLWELQWHPAEGGRVRRMLLSRGRRRQLVALACVLLLAVLALLATLPFGARALLARLNLDRLVAENHELHARGDNQHERAMELAADVAGGLQRARRLAWTLGLDAGLWQRTLPGLPAGDPPDDELVVWLEGAGQGLAALADGLAGRTPAPPCPLESVPSGPVVATERAVPVSAFGWRISPFTGKREAHHGVTVAAPLGEPVRAPGAGRVVFAGVVSERRSNEWTRLGTTVVIEHGGGVYTVLGGLGSTTVRRGQTVRRGESVGVIGQTAWTRVPAVYFEARWPLGGTSRPIDPALVNLALPLSDLEERLANPSAELPEDYAQLEHLPGRSR